MADVRCTDGSVLGVHAVPVLDRDSVPYEVTLRLTRDGAAFGEVGERCGYFLAATEARLRASRSAAGDGAFPPGATEAGLRTWAAGAGQDGDAVWESLRPYLPRDGELFSFRSRDPDDLRSDGALRAVLQVRRSWVAGPPGRWEARATVVLEAWGGQGTGMRAELTSAQLAAVLQALVQECRAVGAVGAVGLEQGPGGDGRPGRRPVG